jgi:hypothetical protein
MFRALDREHMDFALNLWKYADGTAAQRLAFYQKILARLTATDPSVVMPPPDGGGPWPQEWIDLFTRWLQAGAPRLDRATVDPSKLKAVRDPATGTVDITVAGQKPSANHVVWIERDYDPTKLFNEYIPEQFVVYQELLGTASGNPVPFATDDFFAVSTGASRLTIVDAIGNHPVAITPVIV